MQNFQKIQETYAPYFEAIRKKIKVLAIVSAIFFLGGFIEAGKIIRFILSLFRLQNITVATTSPFQLLNVSTTIAFICGATVFFLMLLYYTYSFLKDGLRKNEKKLFHGLVIAGVLLFIIGVMYGFSILYVYLNSVSVINMNIGVANIWDIGTFLSQMIVTSVFLGFIFQFPIVLTFLIRIKVVKVEYLRKKRKVALMLIFLLVGFLPPPDIFSTLIEALPLVILYELAVFINGPYGKKLAAREAAESLPLSA